MALVGVLNESAAPNFGRFSYSAIRENPDLGSENQLIRVFRDESQRHRPYRVCSRGEYITRMQHRMEKQL